MNFLKKLSVRSPWLYRINAGSCNGCDVELATTACIPRYDVERLGCKYCGSPRHADIVLITGPLTARVKDKVLRVWDEIPEPKVTVAVGICPAPLPKCMISPTASPWTKTALKTSLTAARG